MSVKNKKNGVVYTPMLLGEYMVKKLFDNFSGKFKENKIYSILDPSCGTGELLEAAINVAKARDIKVKVIGFDIDSEAILEAESKFEKLGITNELYVADFLDFSLKNSFEGSLFDEQRNTYDFIISNPPYIRTQDLGRDYSQKLAKEFGLKGKIDIYQAFYSAFQYVMHEDTVFSVITSNKFITNKTGASLRQLLHEKYYIEHLIDLGDTKVFDAAVLPAIVVGRLSETLQESASFYSIYESSLCNDEIVPTSEDVLEIIGNELVGEHVVEKQVYLGIKGTIRFPQDHREPWILSSDEDVEWANKIEFSYPFRVRDFGKVRVGIKTTADNVFLNQGFDNFPIEEELLHPIFSSKQATRWHIKTEIEKLPQILYPMKPGLGRKKAEPLDIQKYPFTKAYLETYFEQLDGRQYVKKAGREWFEIWVPQDPSLWGKPKLIWPDISSRANFVFDDSGVYVDGNCYWFVENNDNIEILLLIMGVCNSNVMKRYHEIKFQNKLYANKYRYISQYIEEYPIPDVKSRQSQRIIDIVQELIRTGGDEKLENEIDSLLQELIL